MGYSLARFFDTFLTIAMSLELSQGALLEVILRPLTALAWESVCSESIKNQLQDLCDALKTHALVRIDFYATSALGHGGCDGTGRKCRAPRVPVVLKVELAGARFEISATAYDLMHVHAHGVQPAHDFIDLGYVFTWLSLVMAHRCWPFRITTGKTSAQETDRIPVSEVRESRRLTQLFKLLRLPIAQALPNRQLIARGSLRFVESNDSLAIDAGLSTGNIYATLARAKETKVRSRTTRVTHNFMPDYIWPVCEVDGQLNPDDFHGLREQVFNLFKESWHSGLILDCALSVEQFARPNG
jgi:hypothetical protein